MFALLAIALTLTPRISYEPTILLARIIAPPGVEYCLEWETWRRDVFHSESISCAITRPEGVTYRDIRLEYGDHYFRLRVGDKLTAETHVRVLPHITRRLPTDQPTLR